MEISSQRQAPTMAPRAQSNVDMMMRALKSGASMTALAAMAACGPAFEGGSADTTQKPTTTDTTTDGGTTGQGGTGGKNGTGGTPSTGGHLEGGSGGGTGGTTGNGGHPEGGTGGTTGTGGHLEDGGSTGGAGGVKIDAGNGGAAGDAGGNVDAGNGGGAGDAGGNVDAGNGGGAGDAGNVDAGNGGAGGIITTGSGGTGGGLTTGPGGNGGAGGIITTGSGGAGGEIKDAGAKDASDDAKAEAGAPDGSADAGNDAGDAGGDAGPVVCKPVCPAPINPDCQKIACVDLNGAGTCAVTENTPDGTAISKQIAGDCNTVICDGSGGVENQINDLDVKANSNICVTESCNQGQPIETLNNGAACKTPTGVVCDNGSCVTKPEEMTTFGDKIQAVEFDGNCNTIADTSDGLNNPIHYTNIQKNFTGTNPTSIYVYVSGKGNNGDTDLVVSLTPGSIKNKAITTLPLQTAGPYTIAQMKTFCNGAGFTTVNIGPDNNSGADKNPDPNSLWIVGKAGSESQAYLIQSE